MMDNKIQDTGYRKKISHASCILHHASKVRAQSITEYTVFITVVVLALLAMQTYFKRGIQGKIKDMVSYIGTESYSPNLTYANYYTNGIQISESSYEKGVSRAWVLLDQTNSTSEQVTYPESVP
ncbi:hypothetical protein ACFL2Y_05165 [Candidatus Omnitrophota bacterium]